MRIDMDAPPPEPQFPDHITITTHAELDDLLQVVRADAEAFEDHYGHVARPEEDDLKDFEHWIATNPHHDSTLWYLAMDGDEIAAVCLCQPAMDEDPDMGYVDSMAVRRQWRKQGIALGMLHHAFGEMYRRGIMKVSLHVDASSLTGATRLYEKAGMYVFRNSKRFEKILRDGKDYRTQSVED
jgi:ribosomal protein S18 acetylase RimI-like enzyme